MHTHFFKFWKISIFDIVYPVTTQHTTCNSLWRVLQQKNTQFYKNRTKIFDNLSQIVKNCQKLSKIGKKCPTRTKFTQIFFENRTIFFLRDQKFVNFWLMSHDRITCSPRFWCKKQQKNRLKKVVYQGGFYQWACEMSNTKISFFWIKIFINF